MKYLPVILSAFICCTQIHAQKADAIINAAEVSRIESVLASDSFQGRAIFTPGIEKAAVFINSEFKKAGLKTLPGNKDYYQSFYMLKPTSSKVEATSDGNTVDAKNVIVLSSKASLHFSNAEAETVHLAAGESLSKVYGYIGAAKNYLVVLDTSFGKSFNRLHFLERQINPSEYSTVFVMSSQLPQRFELNANFEFDTLHLANIVGILPGKTKPNEYVIFSGHYDHLGIGKPQNGDSIYNGANDDAAGTTAVIMLAKYFAKQHNNARTLVFAAFTGEESGGYGSKYFSKQFDPAQVMAMFNIEMIGTTSKWGENSAYITGYEKTDMGKILQENLRGSGFTFYPDPYTDQHLFYRSDNATLARLGVPAHTISTSKMDNEPNYHKASDEVSTLDMNNMAAIIKAIAISSSGIISGKQTPSRVDTSSLD